MHNSLYCSKHFRALNIIDEGTRECLAIGVNTSLPTERVITGLECLKLKLEAYHQRIENVKFM